MKNLSYSIASLIVLFTLTIPADLSAQGPTVASSFSIENPVGERVTLDIPNSGVSPYTLLFPASAPTPGSLLYGTAGIGTTDWLAAGSVGTVLQIGINGEPEWSNINILPTGSAPNTTLIWDGTNWVENTNVTMTPGGDITTAGDLTVNGTNVNLPAGSIDNSELANSSISLNYGSGVSGDASVALGGTLNIQNDGILDVVGTTNQVNVSKLAGVATLSTPQDIHSGAAPTFFGMTLTGLTGSSSSSDVLVLNGSNQIETRTIYTLPGGSGLNTTLIWDGTNWVENTNVTMTPGGDITTAGDLTVNGTNVNLPAGSIDNTELANSSVTVNAGTGLSGGGNVALGGSITLNNDGILSVSGIGAGIDVQTTSGAVTVENTGVTGLTAGSGISLSGATGNVTVTNDGILDVVGTTNQVNVSTAAGVATLSTPQDIHTDAVPTFDGLILDNLSSGSLATEVVVSNGGTIETRSLGSLVGGSGRVSTASATNGGSSWSMSIADATVGASNAIVVTYEDPAGGSNKTVHVINRAAGASFDIQFSGKPAAGSFVNYYILP